MGQAGRKATELGCSPLELALELPEKTLLEELLVAVRDALRTPAAVVAAAAAAAVDSMPEH